jgi:FkbM family methyltransferase
MNKSNLKVFLEIGTSDFDTNLEFIDSGNWRGIMVEPSPPFFSNIKKRASQSKYHYNLILDNSVISDSNSFVDFAVSKDVEGWQRGISTVISESHEGTCLYNLGNNKEVSYDKVIKAPCLTLDTLLDKYNIVHLDYLKVDTEGHELNIFKSYSWTVKPTFLKIEKKHIDETVLVSILEKNGYRVYLEIDDLYAILIN